MKRYIGLKVVGIFIITLFVVVTGYLRTTVSINELIATVHAASQPDTLLIKVNEINADIKEAESGIRAFMLTQDEKYLIPYERLAGTIDAKIDSLRQMTAQNNSAAPAIDSVSFFMKQKLNVYDELLSISYRSILDSAFGKLSATLVENDSALTDSLSTSEVRKGWLKRILSSSKKNQLRQQADSAKKVSETNRQKFTAIKKSITDIEATQWQLQKEQTRKELLLLDRDKRLTDKIEQLILKIKADELAVLRKKEIAANNSAAQSGRFILLLMLAGAIVVIGLTVLVLYDITRSASYRKQLAEAKLHAENLARIKEEFLANMSHEIRTPLSAIIGYADRLKKTNLAEKQEQYTKSIQTSSEHLLSIVNDILDLTKIETGNLSFEKINFNPSQIVTEVCDALKLKADEKNLELLVDLNNTEGIKVSGDPLRLKQVLFNLIGNAIKFTEKGFISVTAIADKTESIKRPTYSDEVNAPMVKIRFEISDSGIGIPEEKIKTIFNQFTQADESMSRKFGGSGLGLNISKKFAEMQQGTIEVKNLKPHGACFILTIPYTLIEIDEAPQRINMSEEVIHNATTVKPKPITDSVINENSLSGIKILLAEDDELNRIMQVEMLKDFGAEVIEAVNGLQVIELLQTAACHLILMDIHMPVMNGMEAIEVIRKKIKSQIPVFAMTANVMQQDIASYKMAGFDDYITKPFSETELVNKILSIPGKTISINKSAISIEDETENVSLFQLDELIKASKGNNEFIVKMLKIFLSSAESILHKAKTNAENENRNEVGENVHRLIPSCRQLSVYSMLEKLIMIEKLCQSNGDRNKIIALVNETISSFEKVSFALKKHITLMENE